jgi:UDP-glucose 4-epimerase
LENGTTGIETYEIAGEEDMSVMSVAKIVCDAAEESLGTEVNVELVDNPRAAETMVEEFAVHTSKAHETLGWAPSESIRASVRRLVNKSHS